MSLTGRVKTWSDERNYGFILPDTGGADVFVHRRVIGPGNSLVQHKPVTYEMQISEEGKPKATAVMGEGVQKSAGSMPAAGMQGMQGMPMTGTVRNWIQEKGYGFITQDNGQGDLFVMSKQIRGGTLMPQCKVTYTLGTNPKGNKPWAENVQPMYPPMDAYAAAQFGWGAPGAMPGMMMPGMMFPGY